MRNLKRFLTNWRLIILFVAVLMALFAIAPQPWASGVIITHVAKASAAELSGMEAPNPNSAPMGRERIIAIDNSPVKTVNDYFSLTASLEPEQQLIIKTTESTYRLKVKPLTVTVTLNETEEKTISETRPINATHNETINKTVTVPKTESKVIGTEDIGLRVKQAPTSNLRKGLDIEGGTRVLLLATEKASDADMELAVDNMKQRLNVFGLSDIIVRAAKDLEGRQYVLVEIAGVNEEEVKDLLSRQGKFEASIGNKSVFRGGTDIVYVCRSAACSGIDPSTGCFEVSGSFACNFRFSITLSREAAERQAEATRNLAVLTDRTESYLNESLDLFLDNEFVDSLQISANLQGQALSDISITGSGAGPSQQAAITNSLANMKRLQTILVTGSLPVTLEIIKTDNISPALGEQFFNNALLIVFAGLAAIVLVLAVVYRKLKLIIPIFMTSILEIFLLLGVAALIKQNIDLAAIAGIIAAVGTGIDDQIVITDEIFGSKKERDYSWKERMRNAFFIIMGAYLTLVVAMVPLLFAGAGLLKGFALVTIIGITVGVFITRPAYAATLEMMSGD